MTDDLEPRLRDHLRQRASRVSAPPDVADVHRRIDGRARAGTRALGAALAIALVAGPVAGYALARSTEPDTDMVSASGGGGDSTTPPTYAGDGVVLEGSGAGYLDAEMQPVSDRTTGEGIRLVVRSTELGADGTCAIDGLVRVGIVDGDLIDVAILETAPGNASFGIAGGANGRPMWVVVARGTGNIVATFPNGSVDSAEAVDGIAVLAAYAEGQTSTDLVDDHVVVTGLPGRAGTEGQQEVVLANPSGWCDSAAPVEPPPVMPSPGEPPADEDAARAEITDLFTAAYTGEAVPSKANLHERPAVWLDAQERFRQEHPDYAEYSKAVYGEVDEVVFTAPDRASVRFSVLSHDTSLPPPGAWIGEAVLIDGEWKVSVDTSCGLLGLAGIECDFSIEG